MGYDLITKIERYRDHLDKANQIYEDSQTSDRKHISELCLHLVRKHQNLAKSYVDDDFMDALHNLAEQENRHYDHGI